MISPDRRNSKPIGKTTTAAMAIGVDLDGRMREDVRRTRTEKGLNWREIGEWRMDDRPTFSAPAR